MLSNKKVVIGGCARNIEYYIKDSMNKILEIAKNFNEYKIVIFENDSTDNTLNILKDFESNKNIKIISEKGLCRRINFSRTCKIAYCRNKILDYIETLDYDYFINLDLDDVNIHLDVNNLIKILHEVKIDWDVLTANQQNYYDWWALRTNKYNNNIWGINGLSPNKFILSTWFDNLDGNSINPESEPLPVLSAFGGLGIYKIKSIKGSRYSSGLNKNDCEHVLFHKSIIDKGGKIFIYPKLINKN